MSLLDHTATAQEFERTARTFTNMAAALGTAGATRAAEHCTAFLLGQADWHQDQAAEQNQQECDYRLSELSTAASAVITPTK